MPIIPHQTEEARDAKVLMTLETYWRALAVSRRLPARTQVDPRDIDQALPFSMILEEVCSGIARIRVAGQKVASRFEFDTRGMPLSALFASEAASRLQELLGEAFAQPALVSAPLTKGGELLLLPLEDRFGAPTRALCGVSFGTADGLLAFDPESPLRIVPVDEALQNKRPTQRPALRLVVNNA